ncbi:PAS domain S-box protein [Pararhizobium sp. DWP1-1-3]|uniref:PAS domain S-box protein n=1 Tax=Pararhizobium sp. DWP1-1-3 TaxID=2804652 RepID=UPI003CF9A654
MTAAQTDFVQAIYEVFPSPVIFVDADRVVLSVNAATVEQFGYAADDMIGGSMQMLYASDQDFEAAVFENAAKPGNTQFSEGIHRYRRRDGSVFTARIRVTPVADSDGMAVGFAGVVHDISDYLELDRERRKAGEILDTALQAIPEGFAIFDADERIIVYNDAYKRICGAAGPRLKIGMTAEEIMLAVYEVGYYPNAPVGSPQAKAWLEARMRAFRNPGGDNQIFEYGDGRWLRIEDLKTQDGNTVALRIDVTDLKRAEIALDRQRLEYYTLVQNIPDFICRISGDLRYTFINDRYARLVGMPAEDLIGQLLRDYVPVTDRESLVTTLKSLSVQTPLATREQHRKLSDGSDLWLFWSNIAVFDGGELAEYVTVGRDITELKQQQQRIAQQTAELQRKNEALNQFTGTVSHDLKAPLRHMSMFSDMIVEDVAGGNHEELPVYAGHLRQSARRMDQLIDSLLDYAQIADEIGSWQIVSMSDVISDTILNLDSFIQEAGASIKVSALPQLKGDPELLKRLCQNLIGNAIKYRREDVQPVIRIYAEMDEGAVRVIFEDNGIGVDPRFSRKIFDVFQRLHRDESIYPGTGIGLALAKRIAESHGGSISLDTAFTQGARFVVTLPEPRQSGGK